MAASAGSMRASARSHWLAPRDTRLATAARIAGYVSNSAPGMLLKRPVLREALVEIAKHAISAAEKFRCPTATQLEAERQARIVERRAARRAELAEPSP
jgi:hypothetical protein